MNTNTNDRRTGHRPEDRSPTSPTSPTGPTPPPPPSLPSITARRAARSPAFEQKLRQMALPLAPLVQMTTGEVHPAFPGTLLNFWLLTDAQLEELAHFYHQRTPCLWTFRYPCPITFWDEDLPLEEKRRRIGKFIGLRGCEPSIRIKTEEQIAEDARKASLTAEEDIWRRKGYSWRR